MARFHVDFFQRLKAVAGKAGAHHIDTLRACLRQLDECGFGVRLQPLGFAETGLEGDFVFILFKSQFFSQQARCFMAFAVVRVAQFERALGYAVKAHHQHFGLATDSPVGADFVGQCVDVAGCIVVMVDESEFW